MAIIAKIQLLLSHPLFVEGLTKILGEHFDMTDQGPDLVLIEAALMRDDIAQPLLTANPDVKLVVLGDSNVPEVAQMGAMIATGVHAYVRSSAGIDMLVDIIELVLAGNAVWPSEVMRGLALPPFRPDAVVGAILVDAMLPPRKLTLSPRELTLLDLLRQGESNKAIARIAGLAEATVKVHIKAILRKLRVSNRTQAAVWAMNNREPAINVRSEIAVPGLPLSEGAGAPLPAAALAAAGDYRGLGFPVSPDGQL
jgi:two-component system nitrate/nitrite response regulator NarL